MEQLDSAFGVPACGHVIAGECKVEVLHDTAMGGQRYACCIGEGGAVGLIHTLEVVVARLVHDVAHQGFSITVKDAAKPCKLILDFVGVELLACYPVHNACVEEFRTEVIGGCMALHVGIGVEHALDDERKHHDHRHLLVGKVVLHVIHERGHRVVGTVAADGTHEVEVLAQMVLLDEAVARHSHAAALRVAARHGAVVAANGVAHIVQLRRTFIECLSVEQGIDTLPGCQFLVEIGVGTFAGQSVALVVGHDDQAIVAVCIFGSGDCIF